MNLRALSLLSIALIAGSTALLRADNTPPALPLNGTLDSANAYLYYVGQESAVVRDRDNSGVAAALQAFDLLKNRDPQVAIDFYNKALFNSKSPAVHREARFRLAQLYNTQGQQDKALDQLQQLMLDQ